MVVLQAPMSVVHMTVLYAVKQHRLNKLSLVEYTTLYSILTSLFVMSSLLTWQDIARTSIIITISLSLSSHSVSS